MKRAKRKSFKKHIIIPSFSKRENKQIGFLASWRRRLMQFLCIFIEYEATITNLNDEPNVGVLLHRIAASFSPLLHARTYYESWLHLNQKIVWLPCLLLHCWAYWTRVFLFLHCLHFPTRSTDTKASCCFRLFENYKNIKPPWIRIL